MKSIKDRFVGTWEGTDHGSLDKDEVNFWEVSRTKDGKFYVEFTTHFNNGTIEKSVEKGLWFVDENFFYEQRDGEDEADVYEYKIISDREIYFKDTISNYRFTDNKQLMN